MKIARRIAVPLILIIVSGVAIVLAASNLITLNHTATVATGSTLQIIDEGLTPPTSGCPTTGSYGPGPLNINWGILDQGQTKSYYVCVLNSGTASDTITLSGSPPSGYGTITSPQAGFVLLPTATKLVELDWAMPGNASVGPVPGFSTTIS